LAAAVTDRAWTVEEAIERGVRGRRVVCWHPAFWSAVTGPRGAEARVACMFHHYVFDHFSRPEFVVGLATSRATFDLLRRAEPGKPVRRVDLGGAEDAVPHARRRLATRRVRLLVVGNARAPMCDESARRIDRGRSRKGVELILPLARRLGPRRFAWVFVGRHWGPYAGELQRRGWTVFYPGPLPAPGHYAWMGEGDVFLMLSRIEGGPLPLLEAMGLGIWPVSTATGVAPDVIRSGVNGNLVAVPRPDEDEQAADEVAGLVRSLDPATLAGVRPSVAASVADFTWARFGRQAQAVIEEFLGS
jgi:glycosyltransferase involved in cell wall biosynthesis